MTLGSLCFNYMYYDRLYSKLKVLLFKRFDLDLVVASYVTYILYLQ